MYSVCQQKIHIFDILTPLCRFFDKVRDKVRRLFLYYNFEIEKFRSSCIIGCENLRPTVSGTAFFRRHRNVSFVGLFLRLSASRRQRTAWREPAISADAGYGTLILLFSAVTLAAVIVFCGKDTRKGG